jgi:hypothetical protein
MSPAYRRLLKASRTAHLYLTLFGLVLIVFFAVTGFMLNHEDWFGLGEPRERTAEGVLPTAVLNPVDKFEASEAIRREFGTAGVVNSFRIDDDTIEVEYLRPGGRAVAEAQRDTGRTVVTFEERGWAGVMTDLHKGKSAGRAWGLLIDAVCILLLIISTTGLILWWSLRSRGKWAAVGFLLGTGLAFATYYWRVP